MRREHTRLRTTEAFIKTYGIVHPNEQYESDRDIRLAPDARVAEEARRGLLRDRRLGAAALVRVERRLLDEQYGDAVMPREHEWDSRWWSPIINAEHLRMREAAGVIDLSAFQILDIEGPGRSSTRCSGPAWRSATSRVGRVVYTPVLDAKGGFKSDLTVMRLGDNHFRVVTGGAHGRADSKWFSDHLADGRDAHRPDRRDRRRSGCGARGPATSWPA